MPLIAQKITDRLILHPSRHPLDTAGKTRRMIPFGKGRLEVWTQQVGMYCSDDADLFVLKFQGTAGRAERSTYHPMDYWSDLRAELWSVNLPGYGGSSGPASVKTLAPAAETAYRELAKLAEGRPIVVMGNSLGTVAAMYLAARFPVAGLILRNPPPLRQLIVGCHGWWNLWLGAWFISRHVPRNLDSIENARHVSCPAVFLRSDRDEVVPPIYQQKIIQAYGGPYRLLTLRDADHATPLNLNEQREYQAHLQWLRDEAMCETLSFGTSEIAQGV